MTASRIREVDELSHRLRCRTRPREVEDLRGAHEVAEPIGAQHEDVPGCVPEWLGANADLHGLRDPGEPRRLEVDPQAKAVKKPAHETFFDDKKSTSSK